jgi:hypothetical protein
VTGHRWPLAGIVLVALLGVSLAGVAAPARPRAITPLRVLMVGDSMAETLAHGLEGPVAASYHLDIDDQGVPNCSLAMGTFRVHAFPPRDSAPECQPGSGDPGWPTDWANRVTRTHPAVSVFLARLDVMDRLLNGQWTHIGDPDYDSYLLGQMQLAVRVLSSHGGKVVFLTSPYYDSGTQPDGQLWPEDEPARVDVYNSLLRQVAADHPGVAYVIDLNQIADPNGHYQATIDKVPVRYTDGVHWTWFGDWWLAPRILPQIYQVGARHGGVVTDATTLTTKTRMTRGSASQMRRSTA